ncbi:MAG TPA: hypothetical protein VIK52_07555 [Opitutaceae bacterium]
MHPPILRCLVPGARPEVGPLAEPGHTAPVPALLAIETLTAYLRSVDPHREDRRTWEDFVVDNEICDAALLARCSTALADGRRAVSGRARLAQPAEMQIPSRGAHTASTPWQLRLQLNP